MASVYPGHINGFSSIYEWKDKERFFVPGFPSFRDLNFHLCKVKIVSPGYSIGMTSDKRDSPGFRWKLWVFPKDVRIVICVIFIILFGFGSHIAIIIPQNVHFLTSEVIWFISMEGNSAHLHRVIADDAIIESLVECTLWLLYV